MEPHIKGNKDLFQEDVTEEFDFTRDKKVAWYDVILLNRPIKVILSLLLAAIVIPILIYQFLFFASLDLPPSDGYSTGSCVLPRSARLPCGLGHVPENQCHPQCCYDLNSNFCFHRIPSRFSYISDQAWNEDVLLQPRIATVPYNTQNSIPDLKLSIDEISSTHLTIAIYDSKNKSLNGRRIENKTYDYEIASPELNIEVKAPQGTIFNTQTGPLIGSDNIWEITFKLTNESMFGLGEIPLKEDMVKVIYNNDKDFSSVPLIFAQFNGSYHGLLIDVETPTEVSILGDNQVVVRSIANNILKFHLFVGPEPKDVMRDVMTLIGFDKDKLKYWMLGVHICNDLSSHWDIAYNELNDFLDRARTANIPFESHCGIGPIVFNDDCETDDHQFVNMGAELLRSVNKRFVPHVSPYIQYKAPKNNTYEEDIEEIENYTRSNGNCSNIIPKFEAYMYWNTSDIYIGSVENIDVIYPNYGNISSEFMKSLWTYDCDLDGVILVNNWPIDTSWKGLNETRLALPYFSENFEAAFEDTPLWNMKNSAGEKYLYGHNNYGNNFINAFKNFRNFTDTFISSSSQRMNGEIIINRQNIDASWTNLRRELIHASLGGISGHWFWSSPICGDTEAIDVETQASLCVKWYMAATFLPMIKIYSKTVERHPLSFIGTHQTQILNALNRRLVLLPYIYSTLQSGPLLRPMFYQYPSIEKLKDLTTQFNVGEDLLIVPNLQPSQSHVHIWKPPGTWYELWGGLKLDGETGEPITMTTTEADFMTLIRGGSILVMQKDLKLTAEETRLTSAYSLTIAIDCENTTDTDQIDIQTDSLELCQAEGSLYMSQEMTLNFQADKEKVTINAAGDDFNIYCNTTAEWANRVVEINIYGVEEIFNYDHLRRIIVDVNLCELTYKDEIEINFVT